MFNTWAGGLIFCLVMNGVHQGRWDEIMAVNLISWTLAMMLTATVYSIMRRALKAYRARFALTP